MHELHTHTRIRIEQALPAYHELPNAGLSAATIGFLPAFQDLNTQETHLSVHADGSIATVHLIDNLPDHWVVERDESGRISALKDGIVAGFMRHERFYSRGDLARLAWDA